MVLPCPTAGAGRRGNAVGASASTASTKGKPSRGGIGTLCSSAPVTANAASATASDNATPARADTQAYVRQKAAHPITASSVLAAEIAAKPAPRSSAMASRIGPATTGSADSHPATPAPQRLPARVTA